MRPQDIAALGAEMAALGIARLELTGPDFALTLGRDGAHADGPPDVPEPKIDPVPIAAPSLGTFLRTHPLHEKALAADGESVVAGQAIALLQVGALLTPVPAPGDGIIVAAMVAEGELVGFGDRLFDFLPHD
jgi:acetyl-CoA carboxylase biotin carboxyl carrier protein